MQKTPVDLDKHSSDEQCFKVLNDAIRKHGANPNALIEVLHIAEQQFGYLRDDVLRHVARSLDLPPSKVYGVATFYHFFSLVPRAEHECVVCMGTTCHVKRSAEIAEAIEQEFGISRAGSMLDGRLTVSVARCVGNCCHAPLIILDGELISETTPKLAVDQIRAKLESVPSAMKPSFDLGADI